MYISPFGWTICLLACFAAYVIIDKVIIGHFRKKRIAEVPAGEFGSQKWLIFWTVILTLGIAWNPVGLRIGSLVWVQLGALYRDAEAVINAPVAITAPATGTVAPSAAVPAPAISKNMWTIDSNGLVTFSSPPSGWKWMMRVNSNSFPAEPPRDYTLRGDDNAEVYLQNTADTSKVSTALWLK